MYHLLTTCQKCDDVIQKWGWELDDSGDNRGGNRGDNRGDDHGDDRGNPDFVYFSSLKGVFPARAVSFGDV